MTSYLASSQAQHSVWISLLSSSSFFSSQSLMPSRPSFSLQISLKGGITNLKWIFGNTRIPGRRRGSWHSQLPPPGQSTWHSPGQKRKSLNNSPNKQIHLALFQAVACLNHRVGAVIREPVFHIWLKKLTRENDMMHSPGVNISKQ